MAMNNSLAEVHPELVSEWSDKNKIKPTEVSIGSHMKCFSAAETEDTILLCVTAGALRIIVYMLCQSAQSVAILKSPLRLRKSNLV